MNPSSVQTAGRQDQTPFLHSIPQAWLINCLPDYMVTSLRAELMLQLIHSLLINDASNQCCYTNPSWKLTLGFVGITELAVSAQSHRALGKGSYSGEERDQPD